MPASITTLAAPLTLRSGAILPNRIAKSAMSENIAGLDGRVSDGLVELYRRWGRGGAGLLITGNAFVAVGGRAERRNVVVEDDRDLPSLRRWAEAAQADGSALWMQLNHGGRQTPRFVSWDPVAPSAVGLQGFGGLFSTPRALQAREIEGLVHRFARAASIVQSAGFSGVQIHAAHGYLISQFLSPRTNQRTDEWGGTIEGRMRFLLEVTRAVRRATGAGFGVGVKLNSADFQRGGFTIEESEIVAQALQAESIDLLEISGGSYEKPAMMHGAKRESTRQREAYFLEYAERMRQAVDTPLMLTGGFRSSAAMAAAVHGGAVDVVGIARPLALEPDLPARLLSEAAERAADLRLHLPVRKLNDILQNRWYQRQLERMGNGLDPAPTLGRWSTVLGTLASSTVSAMHLRLRPPPADTLALPSPSMEGA